MVMFRSYHNENKNHCLKNQELDFSFIFIPLSIFSNLRSMTHMRWDTVGKIYILKWPLLLSKLQNAVIANIFYALHSEGNEWGSGTI